MAVIPLLDPALLPDDPGFNSQWHLKNLIYPGIDLNVTSVWDEYQGNGVVVAIIDTGIDYDHPDLAANYRHDLDYDARDLDYDSFATASNDDHGTVVSGVVAAALSRGDAVGVAPGADITGFRIAFGSDGSIAQTDIQLQNIATVDVANNSWGYGGFFYDNFATSTFAASGAALQNAVAVGRDGLGSVVTFAASNSRQSGDDVNYHSFQSSRFTIAVGAVEQDGDIAYFSTPGAAVLVSAPGSSIFSTDVQGAGGYSSGDYTTLSATSFAAPAVAGVVALMLEANGDLGYRDVQEILAYSSVNPLTSTSGWQTNGADNWNGGGLTFSHDYGFGMVDGHAAVRLAETWTAQSTEGNLVIGAYNDLVTTTFIPDNATITSTAFVSTAMNIDQIEVHLSIDHSWIGDLTVELISPDGTVSTLMNRPGVSSSSTFGASKEDIDFTFTSVANWGETGQGEWTLNITDSYAADVGFLQDWDLTFYGDALTDDNTYIFTDEWARLGSDATRQALTDLTGIDTLNFASLTGALTLDLTPGTTNSFLGNAFVIDTQSVFEVVYGGDGDDIIAGNAADNTLYGMRGGDNLMGGAGDDTLIGGSGNDLLSGGDGTDTARFAGNYADYTITADAGGITVTVTGADGVDSLIGIEFLQFDDQTVTASVVQATDDAVTATEDQALTITAATLLANDIASDGGSLTITAVAGATIGTVALDGNGDITYSPLADYSGADSFNYTVATPGGGSATGTVTVTVNAQADAPSIGATVATPRTVGVSSGSLQAWIALDISGALNDTDGSEALSVTVSGLPAGAMLSTGTDNGDGSWTLSQAQLGAVNLYLSQHPGADFGITLTATATESQNGDTASTSAIVTVDMSNVIPEALDGSVTLAEDGTLTGQLGGADFDGDSLAFTALTQPTNGAVMINGDGSYSFTPEADWNGSDSFTFTISDGNGGADSGAVTVTPVNDAPVANPNAIAAIENGATIAIDVLANDTDIDSDDDATTLTVVSAVASSGAVVTFSGLPGEGISYDPDSTAAFDGLTPGETATDTITYVIEDSHGAQSSSTVAVTVTGTNDAPVAAGGVVVLPRTAWLRAACRGRMLTTRR